MSRPEHHQLNRRNFLASLGAGLAATAFVSDSLFSVEASRRLAGRHLKDEPLILGAGNHKYEWVRGWGKLPAGMEFGATHGAVQIDAKGLIYFNTDTENAIIVFDANGNFVRSMAKEWKGNAHGMQIRREGSQEFIYVTNVARGEFGKLTLTGETVWAKGFPEKSGVYKNKSEFKPTGIAFAPNGEFYVTDGYGANYVHRYDAKGEYLSSWGGKSTKQKKDDGSTIDLMEDGKFNTPHAIIIDSRGKTPTVLVTDRANHRLQWFSLEGKHLKTLPGDGDLLRLPATLHIRGTDLAVGDLSGRVSIFDKDNKLVTHLGDNMDPKKRATNKIPRDGWMDGQFIAPHGICWDKQGNLYVEEWMAIGRIVKLKRLK
jgi:DNA-binding beta-propeller fold protein YncE